MKEIDKIPERVWRNQPVSVIDYQCITGNNADRIGQTVVGLYNKTNSSDLFVVGAGTDASNPKNALEELTTDGILYYSDKKKKYF